MAVAEDGGSVMLNVHDIMHVAMRCVVCVDEIWWRCSIIG